jgi:hypothetical protein
VSVTREGLWREWSVARLKRKKAPAYIAEFLRVLTESPMRTLKKRNGKISLEAARRAREVRPRAAAAAARARRLITA